MMAWVKQCLVNGAKAAIVDFSVLDKRQNDISIKLLVMNFSREDRCQKFHCFSQKSRTVSSSDSINPSESVENGSLSSHLDRCSWSFSMK